MKKYSLYIYYAIVALLVTSCMDHDMEYDILDTADGTFITSMDVMNKDHKSVLASKVIPATMMDENGVEQLKVPTDTPEIILTVKAEADLSELFLTATLSSQSSYAKVSPILGTLQDFTSDRQYTVTSQSGKKKLVYNVKVIKQP